HQPSFQPALGRHKPRRASGEYSAELSHAALTRPSELLVESDQLVQTTRAGDVRVLNGDSQSVSSRNGTEVEERTRHGGDAEAPDCGDVLHPKISALPHLAESVPVVITMVCREHHTPRRVVRQSVDGGGGLVADDGVGPRRQIGTPNSAP